MITGRMSQIARNFMSSAIRRGHDHGGVPGKNLPFGIENKYRFTALFIAFFGSGIAAPYLIVRYSLLKK